jgi:magnesium-transporting ATPase (P-type)
MLNSSIFEKIIKWLGYLVIVLFFLLAVFLIFSNYFSYLPLNIRIVFAVLLLAYAFFRAVTINNKKNEKDEDE